jgi:hypothetical protein
MTDIAPHKGRDAVVQQQKITTSEAGFSSYIVAVTNTIYSAGNCANICIGSCRPLSLFYKRMRIPLAFQLSGVFYALHAQFTTSQCQIS